ncbi:MAG: hypothetical protein HQK49_06335 [Oligoflexia bacterium]|nr:hypothetical protein [Oligoflexia bacterium]
MKRLLKSFLLVLSVGIFSTSLMADPLPDSSFLANSAGWYPSIATPCLDVCLKQQARAENEAYVSDITKKTFVCKVNARNAKGELYGNNFSDNGQLKNQCMVVDHKGTVYVDRAFKCLCVKARVIGPINPPEPPGVAPTF